MVLVTEEFVEPAEAVSRASGMPGVPVIVLPHPMAGSGKQNLKDVAAKFTPRILDVLKGGS